MIIGIPKETYPGERRVALTPENIPVLTKIGLTVLVESGAGASAGFPDDEYAGKGAAVVSSRPDIFARADIIAQVRTIGANPETGPADVELIRKDQIIIGMAEPLTAHDATKSIAAKGAALLALELMPRIARAQAMDVLSSMATVAGYKAVLLAAEHAPRMFPMLMTAAGTLKPAKVFVVGAGVAGLMAIATAKRLGAVVSGYDVRPAVKEQVQSLGGKFVELELDTSQAADKGGYARELDEEILRKQREMMFRVVAESDVVITTAAVPGKKAPMLITTDMIKGMAPGSVVVDLAAERGGNCEPTIPEKIIEVNGVTIIGLLNLPSTVPYHASQMFSRNLVTYLRHLVKDGTVQFNMDDEITRETVVTRAGEIVHPFVKQLMNT